MDSQGTKLTLANEPTQIATKALIGNFGVNNMVGGGIS